MQQDINVSAIFDIPLFKENGEIIAGESGLSRPIRYITVMEAPDFSVKTLHKETVVLTTFSAYSRQLKYMNNVVKELGEHGIAALAIKLGRYIDEVDQSTIDIANEYNLPLLTLSKNVLFSEAISNVLSLVSNRQHFFVSSVNTMTNDLLHSIIEGQSIANILEIFTAQLDCSCAVFDGNGDMMYKRTQPSIPFNEEVVTGLIKQYGESKKPIPPYLKQGDSLAAICIVQGNALGYLGITTSRDISEQDLIYIQQVVSFISIKFLEQHLKLESSQRTVQPIIDQLILSSSTLTENQAKDKFALLDIVPKEISMVAILRMYKSKDDEGNNEIITYLNFWREQIKKVIKNFRIYTKGNDYLIFFSFTKTSKFSDYSYLKKKLEEALPLKKYNARIGLGLYTKSFSSLSYSYNQAKGALKIAQHGDTDKTVIAYSDCFVSGMLTHCISTKEYDYFRERIIEPIVNYNPELLNTLRVCVKNNILNDSADELYIHISTLRYRLNKVEELTGFDFFSALGRYVLTLAVNLYSLESSSQHILNGTANIEAEPIP